MDSVNNEVTPTDNAVSENNSTTGADYIDNSADSYDGAVNGSDSDSLLPDNSNSMGGGDTGTDSNQGNSGAENSELDAMYSDQAQPENNVPDEYDFADLTDENGQEYNQQTRDMVSEVARSLNMSNDQARNLLSKGVSVFIKSQAKARQAMAQQWQSQVMNDSELGGDNKSATVSNINFITRQFGSDEVRQILRDTGLGYHPAFVRFLNNIAKGIRPAGNVVKGTPPQPKKDLYAELFPNSEA